jgi:hypothetical protein
LKDALGEIKIAPKIIYFVELPSTFGEEEKLDLLKRDILVVEKDGNIDTLPSLFKNNTKNTAFFYNLENILLKNRVKKEELYTFAANMAMFIKNYMPDKSVVHTSFIDDNISFIFRSEGIPYIEKSLTDKKVIYNTILSCVKPLFIENQKMLRSSLRLNLIQNKFRAEIINLTDKLYSPVEGYIKDLSLNGIGLILKNKEEIRLFKLKDNLQIKLYLNRSIIKIDLSIATRIFSDHGEIGVSFNITDDHMIRDEYANRLTSIIYSWMKNVIEKSNNINTDQIAN